MLAFDAVVLMTVFVVLAPVLISIDVVLQFAGVAQLAAEAVVVVESVLFLLQVFRLEVSWEIVVVQGVVGFVVAAGQQAH